MRIRVYLKARLNELEKDDETGEKKRKGERKYVRERVIEQTRGRGWECENTGLKEIRSKGTRTREREGKIKQGRQRK